MYSKKLIAAMAVLIFILCVPVASEMRAIGLDESSGPADVQGSNPLMQESIVLAANDNNRPDDTEKATSGSETKGSEPATDDKNKSSNAKSKPLKPFVPSEKIPAEQAVDFPVDI